MYLAEKITNELKNIGVISSELYEVYRYGIQIGLEMCSCFLVCLCISVYLHMVLEFLISNVILMLLRSYAGGMHLHSFGACFICSVTVQTMLLLINARYTLTFLISWFIIGTGILFILKVAPVENINRRLDFDEKEHCRMIVKKILAGIVLFAVGCTLINESTIVSLIALTILQVTLSQYIGVAKYKFEKNRRR